MCIFARKLRVYAHTHNGDDRAVDIRVFGRKVERSALTIIIGRFPNGQSLNSRKPVSEMFICKINKKINAPYATYVQMF